MVPPLRSALITCRISVGWGCNMSSISCARIAYVDIKANRFLLNAPLVSAAGVRNVIQMFAVARKHTPFASHKNAAETEVASHGLASFYTEGTQTANGEKFDTHELTAAHRTLPFGTRLRVTSVATGRSVTVRVNDRGPFIPGRVVDVSYSAAQTLGMVGGGIAKVKLDVVQ